MKPEYLKRWTHPDFYAGAEWPEYFVFLGRHRDSDTLARSNFDCGLAALGGESETVLVIREGHWAVGWVEWIAIHETDARALAIADGIARGLRDYPVVDEDHFCELEWNETTERWENMDTRERIYWLARADLSIFAARRAEFPQDDSGVLFDMLRG